MGFPGETESDFEDTLGAVRAARFASAFTFKYSPRPGTPAADLPRQIDEDVVQDRYDRLIAVVEETALAGNRAVVGSDVEVLVSVGEGRKDGATGRVSGRARDGRLVHVTVGDAEVRPGDVVRATVTYGAPHHLMADGGIIEHRHWRGRAVAKRRNQRPVA